MQLSLTGPLRAGVPPPPPPAVYPWPEALEPWGTADHRRQFSQDGTAKPGALKPSASVSPSAPSSRGAPCGEQVYVNGDEDPECTKKAPRALGPAVCVCVCGVHLLFSGFSVLLRSGNGCPLPWTRAAQRRCRHRLPWIVMTQCSS